MRKILIWQFLILITVFGLTAINSKAQMPQNASVNDSRLIQPVSDDVCDNRLAKTLDALEKAEGVIKSLQAEAEARRRLDAVNDEIITAKDAVIIEQKKLIVILQKQSKRKISILFGIIKVSY